MIGLIGKKVGMTTLYNETGHSLACTVIQGGPCVVTQVKTVERDGYRAIQLGYQEKKEKHTTRPLLGHFKKAKCRPQRKLVELKGDELLDGVQSGQTLRLEDVFAEGEYVDVVGTSKGKGFQGVVRRHGFRGVGDRTHGQHNRERAPGSLGGSSYPARVFKGLRMAGRMGGKRVKVENLKVLKLIPEKNLMIVGGSVPGANQSYVVLEK